MARTAFVKVGTVLLGTLGEDLDDESALVLQSDIGTRVVATRATGVLLDISALQIVDSFICKVLSDTASIVRTLGAEVALVGMRPPVAITLVELGLPLAGVVTARDVDAGIRALAEHRAQRARSESWHGAAPSRPVRDPRPGPP